MSKKHDIAMVNVQKNVALPWPNIYILIYIYINTLYIKIYIITIMQINYYLKKNSISWYCNCTYSESMELVWHYNGVCSKNILWDY